MHWFNRKPKPKFQYQVVYSAKDYGSYMDFVYNVNNQSKDGWELVGGVCVCLDKNGHEQFYQAMRKDNA